MIKKQDSCNGEDFVVRYGDWVEISGKNGSDFFYSFKVIRDMCMDSLRQYLMYRARMPKETEFKIRVIKRAY